MAEQGRRGTFYTDLQFTGPCQCQTLGARPLVVGGGSEAGPRLSYKTGFP